MLPNISTKADLCHSCSLADTNLQLQQPAMHSTQLISSQRGGASFSTGCRLLLQALAVSYLLVLCLAPAPGGAAPAYESWSVYKATLAGSLPRRTNECEISSDVQTLCQQCAKVTRSNLVYPMCCEDHEEARPWCHSYVNFGI